MKTVILIALTGVALCSCDSYNANVVVGGHYYMWVPIKHGHYEHDPLCSQCAKDRREIEQTPN